MIAGMMGHASVETTLSSYVKSRWRATPEDCEVLGRFAPPHLRQQWRIFPRAPILLLV